MDLHSTSNLYGLFTKLGLEGQKLAVSIAKMVTKDFGIKSENAAEANQ